MPPDALSGGGKKVERMKRAILAAIMAAVIIIGGAGCMKDLNTNKIPDISTEKKPGVDVIALEYMEQKYGEEFVYASAWGAKYTGTYSMMTTCASLKDERVLVQAENYKSEDCVIKDNYIAVKYKQETVAFLRDCAEAAFASAEIHYDVREASLSPELSVDATLEDFLSGGGVPLVVMVEVRESDYQSEEQIEKVSKLIAESGAEFHLTIAVVKDELYGTFDRTSLNAHISAKKCVRCANTSNVDGEMQISWFQEG